MGGGGGGKLLGEWKLVRASTFCESLAQMASVQPWYLDHDKLCWRICLVVLQVEARKSEVKDVTNEDDDDDDDDDDEDMVVRVKNVY